MLGICCEEVIPIIWRVTIKRENRGRRPIIGGGLLLSFSVQVGPQGGGDIWGRRGCHHQPPPTLPAPARRAPAPSKACRTPTTARSGRRPPPTSSSSSPWWRPPSGSAWPWLPGCCCSSQANVVPQVGYFLELERQRCMMLLPRENCCTMKIMLNGDERKIPAKNLQFFSEQRTKFYNSVHPGCTKRNLYLQFAFYCAFFALFFALMF